MLSGRELRPGITVVIKTLGSRLNFHSYLHLLITEGGESVDEHLYRVHRFNDYLIRTIFTREMFLLQCPQRQNVQNRNR
jgi:hypothetical protein